VEARGAWVFMTKRGGRQRPIGLGSAHDVSLKDREDLDDLAARRVIALLGGGKPRRHARDLADACRRAVRLGCDPRTVLAEAAGELTFDAAARELIESMAPGWRNAKHRAQWSMTAGRNTC
jgi:hypothetical protein